jgi:ATP-dependent RNA helicase DHX57
MEAMDLAWQTLLDLGIVEGEDQRSRLTALGRHVSLMIPALTPATLAVN